MDGSLPLPQVWKPLTWFYQPGEFHIYPDIKILRKSFTRISSYKMCLTCIITLELFINFNVALLIFAVVIDR